MLELIESMLNTQKLVNEVSIGKDWIFRSDCAFHLAIQQECAEGIDHLGWKWWAKQEVSIPRAQVEVVDIMHFTLAAELRAGYETLDDEPAVSIQLLNEYRTRKQSITIDALEFFPAALNARQLFSLISTMAGLGYTAFGLTILLGEKLGIPFQEFYRLYSAKATLNLFRQKHGYKEGTYKKIWVLPNIEDNEVMQELMDKIDWDKPTAAHVLYHELESAYRSITAAP